MTVTEALAELLPCKRCGVIPHARASQKIESLTNNNPHPLAGLVVSNAYVICSCGWQAAPQPFLNDVVSDWNDIMGN